MEAALAQIHPAVAELRPGQRFEGRYACLSKDRLVSRSGSAYLSLRLRDRSGEIAARAFRDADRLGLRFEAGDAIAVRGKVERYRGDLVVEVDDARRLEPGSFDPGDFLPAAYRSVDELEGFLEHLTREIADPALREVVESLVFTGELADDFRRAPCTRASHHAYLGGLLEHTVAVATLVGETCILHPRLDSDMLMAAAIVHDCRPRPGIHLRRRVRAQRGGPAARAPGDRRPARRRGRGVASGAAPARAVGVRALPPRARRRPRSRSRRRRLPSAEALALYRLNALDASVKGALERGLRP